MNNSSVFNSDFKHCVCGCGAWFAIGQFLVGARQIVGDVACFPRVDIRPCEPAFSAPCVAPLLLAGVWYFRQWFETTPPHEPRSLIVSFSLDEAVVLSVAIEHLIHISTQNALLDAYSQKKTSSSVKN